MRRLPLVWLASILLVPTSVSQTSLLFGTEELPELPPSGPPQYATGYTGPRDHTYLEIRAGWFGYDNGTDEVIWTLKTRDGSGYGSPAADWYVGCSAAGNVTVGDNVRGSLRFSWGKSPDRDGSSAVSFTYAAGNFQGAGETTTAQVDHRFRSEFSEAGLFEFTINRTDVLKFGDQMQQFAGSCSEYYSPPVDGGFIVTAQFTRNAATSRSEAVYSFLELRRIRAPDGTLDPIERLEANATQPPGSESASDTPVERTPAPGVVVTVFAVMASILVRVRKLQE